MKQPIIAWILLLLTSSACGTLGQQYPPPAYPATESASIVLIPTPSSPDRATVIGVLLLEGNPRRPVTGAILYLASVIPEARGTPWLVGFDRQSPLRTQTDSAGRFVFVDVPIGKYSLVLDRIHRAFLLRNPEDGSDLLIQPQPGQVLDLGNLSYSLLPGENPYP